MNLLKFWQSLPKIIINISGKLIVIAAIKQHNFVRISWMVNHWTWEFFFVVSVVFWFCCLLWRLTTAEHSQHWVNEILVSKLQTTNIFWYFLFLFINSSGSGWSCTQIDKIDLAKLTVSDPPSMHIDTRNWLNNKVLNTPAIRATPIYIRCLAIWGIFHRIILKLKFHNESQ